MDVLQLFFGFKGCINRARYWMANAALLILMLVLALLQYGLTVAAGEIVAAVFGCIVFVVMMLSGFALGAKRLHDRDRSSWLLLFQYIPVLIIVPAIFINNAFLILLGTAFGITVAISLFVELGCLRGTIGPNRFGPDPLEREAQLAIRSDQGY
ncbi:DUF805 domain-containing protein [Microvirga sp. CF3016]|uniref:DUF805 domain-containing protein n=1 Tax=Microvirga sp. CF3016 TaxID=3110181 RepID=UPI002E773D74|nr:DUF805 domain-containing protein [Microvirga sp. CF3016]MEE1611723.1 DUF805 domain-containing protein [Microvirga sp. CF3016]